MQESIKEKGALVVVDLQSKKSTSSAVMHYPDVPATNWQALPIAGRTSCCKQGINNCMCR